MESLIWKYSSREQLLPGPGGQRTLERGSDRRGDHIVGGIYRISVWSPDAALTFNPFLIDDESPTLVHTGRYLLTRELLAEPTEAFHRGQMSGSQAASKSA